ncbi:MAG TPA: hypothetical protein VGR91_16485 [Stellaceae bacterium]|nr:hypothetical protein [Stellaceae bacterium]
MRAFALPRVCDAVYASSAFAIDGATAAFFWARRCYERDAVLSLMLIEAAINAPIAGFFVGVERRLQELARLCRARHGSVGNFLAGEGIARQAQQAGCRAHQLPEHIAGMTAVDLGVAVTGHVAAGAVVIAREALEAPAAQAWTAMLDLKFDREDDPVALAFLRGIALGLDEVLARPRRTGR